MDLSGLSFYPGFRRVDDFPAVFGVGTVVLLGAGVTGVGGCPIPHDLAHRIAILRMQMMSAWAFPDVQMAVILEASRAELSRTPMRVPTEPFQSGRHHYEEGRIPGSQRDLNVQRSDHG